MMYEQLMMGKDATPVHSASLQDRIVSFLSRRPESTAAEIAAGVNTSYQATHTKLIALCQSRIVQRKRSGQSATGLQGAWIFRLPE